jgi:RNA-directed DNA polymerase
MDDRDTSRKQYDMNTVTTPMDEWNQLPWKPMQRQVFRLQKRIYQASQRGDVKAVHKLQRLLMQSWSARCLAVRKVTQDNRGKKAAGVDGVKSLKPPERLLMARRLRLPQKARPTRRVWIPKPGTQDKRGLGIPTMQERAAQALAKLALEPEWEARFEPNSYGFRPGRSCHDAIRAIFDAIKSKPKYVLDADIAKCFDRINHDALLNKLQTFPTLRRAIRAWLRAGVMDGGALFPTTEGTPQGGVISPLLANIALHGFETVIRDAYPERKPGTNIHWKPIVVRYADDFVVMHEDETVIQQVQQRAMAWLAGMGLELKPSKTKITHTLSTHNGNVGFDFLGFTVRQFPAGKTHTGKSGGKGRVSTPLGFKTIIKPSHEAIRRHSLALAEIVDQHKPAPQAALIARLNPVIRGWATYYAPVQSKATFSKMAALTYLKLRRWAKRRHTHKSWHWIVRKYWRLEQGTWDFATRDGTRLYKHNRTPIRRHIKVRGAKSPFDGDWVYWATRLGTHPELPQHIARLLKRQQGKCAWCGLYFQSEDVREQDHLLPTVLGGGEGIGNRQLLHAHCHDVKTARDGSLTARGTRDKGHLDEEPDEAKASRPVLQTSRNG